MLSCSGPAPRRAPHGADAVGAGDCKAVVVEASVVVEVAVVVVAVVAVAVVAVAVDDFRGSGTVMLEIRCSASWYTSKERIDQ